MSPAAPAPPSRSRPSVFRYLDARRFLAEAFESAKAGNRAFSHRYVARAMGARSSSFFKDVVSGRIGITPARARAFARLFKLPRNEAEYFLDLVAYTQAESEEERRDLLHRLTEAAPSGGRTLETAFRAEYFSRWHYAAVRELLALRPFRDDFAELADALRPAISPAEAEDAIRLLRKLKLIRRNAQGVYERADKVVRSGASDPEAVRPALEQNLDLARRALDAWPPGLRPFSYLTLSVSGDSLERIRERVRAFRSEVLEIAARDEKVDRLVQLNLQLFPLTDPPAPRRNP